MNICRKILLNIILLGCSGVLATNGTDFSWQGRMQESGPGQWQITVKCSVAENCYLDSGMTFVNILSVNSSSTELTPQSVPQDGKYLTGTHVWQGTATQKPVQAQVIFQGCRGGECLFPQELNILLEPDRHSKTATADHTGKAAVTAPDAQPGEMPGELAAVLDEYKQIRTVSGLLTEAELIDFLQGKNTPASGTDGLGMSFWALLLLVLLGGLGLNLTPCVLPMIPINLAIIGASGTGRWQGFRRGGAYALGITLAYGALGLLAALGGSNFGALNSSSIFNWVIAAVFVLLALGMFGVYELDFSRFSTIFSRRGTKKFKLPPEISAFGMGIVAALLAGACVAPVVITVVLLAARLYSEGHVWGIALPFALGFAMALPWPLLGAGLSFLPRPGAWMVRVKQLFGVIICIMAIYYGYLGWSLRSGAVDQQLATGSFTAELQQAAANNETVLIDCWATWCKNCTELEKRLNSPEVQNVLQNNQIRVIKFQAEKSSDPTVKAFMQKYDLRGLPSLVLLKKGSQP